MKEVAKVDGSYIQQNSRTLLSALELFRKYITKLHQDLADTCSSDEYMLKIFMLCWNKELGHGRHIYFQPGATIAGSHPSRALTAVQVKVRPPSSPSTARIEHPHSSLTLHDGCVCTGSHVLNATAMRSQRATV